MISPRFQWIMLCFVLFICILGSGFYFSGGVAQKTHLICIGLDSQAQTTYYFLKSYFRLSENLDSKEIQYTQDCLSVTELSTKIHSSLNRNSSQFQSFSPEQKVKIVEIYTNPASLQFHGNLIYTLKQLDMDTDHQIAFSGEFSADGTGRVQEIDFQWTSAEVSQPEKDFVFSEGSFFIELDCSVEDVKRPKQLVRVDFLDGSTILHFEATDGEEIDVLLSCSGKKSFLRLYSKSTDRRRYRHYSFSDLTRKVSIKEKIESPTVDLKTKKQVEKALEQLLGIKPL